MNGWMDRWIVRVAFLLGCTVHMLYSLQNSVCSLVISYVPHPINFLSRKMLWPLPIHCSWLRFTSPSGSVLVPIGPGYNGPHWIWFYISSRYLLTVVRFRDISTYCCFGISLFIPGISMMTLVPLLSVSWLGLCWASPWVGLTYKAYR